MFGKASGGTITHSYYNGKIILEQYPRLASYSDMILRAGGFIGHTNNIEKILYSVSRCSEISIERPNWDRQNNSASEPEVYAGGFIGWVDNNNDMRYCMSQCDLINIVSYGFPFFTNTQAKLGSLVAYLRNASALGQYAYNKTTNCLGILKSLTVELDRLDFYFYVNNCTWKNSNFCNSDVSISQHSGTRKTYFENANLYTLEQMKTDAFLEELNKYSVSNLDGPIWEKSDDGFPQLKQNASIDEPVNIYLPSEISIGMDETVTIPYTLEPDNVRTDITWESGDQSIVTVTSSGDVTGLKEGTTSVTATTANGKSASCMVTVDKDLVSPTSIRMDHNSFFLEIGDSMKMRYKLEPENATTLIIWKSRDTSIATVSPDGIVKGIKQGYVDISAITPNKEHSAVVRVYVGKASDNCYFYGITPEDYDVTYKVTDINDKTCAVVSCEKTAKTVVIPSSVQGFKVTSITNEAFSHCEKLESITLPNTLTTIGSQAFYGCESLKSITLPSSVTKIESSAFRGCKSLTNISGFNNVEYIGSEAFSGTPWLANLPDGENYIGKVLFNYKGKMPANTTLKVKEGCTQISYKALCDQDGLVAIHIPSSVVDLGSFALSGCNGLSYITIATDNPIFDSRDNCNAIIATATDRLILACNNTVIPNTVKTIGYNVFSNNMNIATITIPNSVTTIEFEAFSYMSNLRSITIGKNVKTIGKYILENTSFDKNLKSIRSLIDFPTDIDKAVFRKCKGQEDSIYNHVTLYIPKGSKANYQSAAGWKNFKHIVEISDDEAYNGMCFTEKTIEGVDLTYVVTDVGKKECELIASPVDVKGKVTIPSSVNGFTVRSIGDKVFYSYNNALTEVIISNSITKIGSDAFFFCSKLENMILGSSLEYIGFRAFYGTGITSINIPKSVESIGSHSLGKCVNLQSITVEDGNSYYDSRNGCNAIYVKATNKLLAGCMNTVISEETDTIGEYAFYGHSELKEIKLPENLKIIEACAFMSTGISTITIPEPVDSIGTSAFRNCPNLTTFKVMSKEPIRINEYVFFGCTDEVNTFNNATLYVPKGTKVKYQEADVWKNFKNIVEFEPSGIDDIIADEDKQRKIFSISGISLKRPQKGLNIINGMNVVAR